jgi:hypothetical protein
MNTGIQDAVNLAWKLTRAVRPNANPALLDTYDRERAPVGRNVLRFTDRAFTVATTDNTAVRFARRNIAPVAMRLLTKSKTGRRYVFRTVAQLAIRYRHSPLSVNGAGTVRWAPRAGDRLPDGPIRHDGRDSTLHRLLAQPGWHLLDIGGTTGALPTDAWRDLTAHRLGSENDRDVDTVIGAATARRLGLTPARNATILVRPDGHIGYRSDSDDPDQLVRYLDDWLGGTARAAPDRP